MRLEIGTNGGKRNINTYFESRVAPGRWILHFDSKIQKQLSRIVQHREICIKAQTNDPLDLSKSRSIRTEEKEERSIRTEAKERILDPLNEHPGICWHRRMKISI
jgi:hypothetical protein